MKLHLSSRENEHCYMATELFFKLQMYEKAMTRTNPMYLVPSFAALTLGVLGTMKSYESDQFAK